MADLLNKVGTILPSELKSSNIKDVSEVVNSDVNFEDMLKEAIDETNELQSDAQKAATDIATGEVKNLHQAAIAIGEAETSLKLMLEIRNKAVSAYKEILRTQM